MLLADAEAALEEQLLLGEAQCSESVCPTTFGNALQLLIAEEILEANGNPRLPDTRIVAGSRRESLRGLADRVARVLTDL